MDPESAPAATRTRNLLIRSQMLYPIELRVLFRPGNSRDPEQSTAVGMWQLFRRKMWVSRPLAATEGVQSAGSGG